MDQNLKYDFFTRLFGINLKVRFKLVFCYYVTYRHYYQSYWAIFTSLWVQALVAFLRPVKTRVPVVPKQLHSKINLQPFKQVKFVLFALSRLKLFCISPSVQVSMSSPKTPPPSKRDL